MIYEMGEGKMKRIDVPENHQKNNLPVGTILQLNGYNNPKYVIIKNLGINEKSPYYGARYLVVSLEDYSQSFKDAYLLKYISEKKDNRIQTYITNEVLEPSKVLEIWEKSKEKIEKMRKELQKKREEEERLEEEGRRLFKKYIPENAKALIVAKYEVDKCDLMTDYFATETKEMVILGYS